MDYLKYFKKKTEWGRSFVQHSARHIDKVNNACLRSHRLTILQIKPHLQKTHSTNKYIYTLLFKSVERNCHKSRATYAWVCSCTPSRYCHALIPIRFPIQKCCIFKYMYFLYTLSFCPFCYIFIFLRSIYQSWENFCNNYLVIFTKSHAVQFI